MKKRRLFFVLAAAAILGAIGWTVRDPSWLRKTAEQIGLLKLVAPKHEAASPAPVITADGKLILNKSLREKLHLRVAEVKPPPPTDVLRLPGSLGLDPNRLLRIHSRFAGEIISIGQSLDETALSPEMGGPHVLRYGDMVRKGQVIAVVWSREIGEKKSELVDALCKLRIDKNLLDRLLEVREGVVAERERLDAKRNYEGDLVNVARAERTLRSWKLSEEEIAVVYREADEVAAYGKSDKVRTGPSHPGNDSRWAELEIRAPIDGVILEKNFNEGSFIDSDDDVFKVADTSVLQVLANVYEEQLPLLGSLPESRRIWKVEVKSDPLAKPRVGRFALIGRIIDPQQHTAKVVGWLDNADNRLTAGQFITATIEVPAEPGLVVVPTQAILEEGDKSLVMVQSLQNEEEFTLRKVAIARREREVAYVRSTPGVNNVTSGLEVGEKVVASGVLTLAAELRLHEITGSK